MPRSVTVAPPSPSTVPPRVAPAPLMPVAVGESTAGSECVLNV